MTSREAAIFALGLDAILAYERVKSFYTRYGNAVQHSYADAVGGRVVYHRGAMPLDAPYLVDLVKATDAEKDLHVWQQDLGGFEWLIERLTWPGDLICDPFIGSGTTAVAALRKERQFIGCDVDPAAIGIAERRLEP